MRVRIVSYTKAGRAAAARVAAGLEAAGHSCRRFALPKFCGAGDEPLTDSPSAWAGEGFRTAEALIFCCAAGIAVRAVAPWVRDKTADPAVLVIDEGGRFVIPILSGHLGGANDLAVTAAALLGAVPVLTTATDGAGVFAVDVFAKNNHLRIEDMRLAKAVSAALLAGEPVGFRSDLPWEGALPEGLTAAGGDLGIWVSASREEPPFPRTLRLTPRRYAAGLGCRRGKRADELSAFLAEQLAACGVRPEELRCIASIDLKKDEPGLTALCEALGAPLLTYTAEALRAVPGGFTGSDFVRARTGVDSVCERAAVLASGGSLVKRKTAADGMTFALARFEEVLRFD